MGKVYDAITPELQDWCAAQHVFFVATAPLAGDGLVNCSPKGVDSFRVLGPHDVAYVDLTGSGIETVAHLRENGRIVFMFCAFDGPPKIVRLHGTGHVVEPGSPEFESLRSRFPDYLGTRAIVRATITRIADSCGFAVPRLDHVADRDTLTRWTDKRGPAGLVEYRNEKNAQSIDGLSGLDPVSLEPR
jgi:hypothetical protein